MPELVSCPHCGKPLRVPDHLLNRTVKCPSCTSTFVATASAAGAPPADEPPAPPPRRPRPADEAFSERPAAPEDDEDIRPQRRSEDSDWEDDDLDDDRPRRRSRRRRRHAVAEGLVMGPAIALLVVGILGILMGLANILSAATGFGVAPQQQKDAAHMTGRFVGAAVSLVWGLVVTLGGWKLKSLESYGSAMTGVIVSLLPCNPCCLVGLPIGIWALVVMNNQDVKDAFR